MTWHARPESDRWVELMAGRVLDDLTRDEASELDALGEYDGSFELAATAIDIALSRTSMAPMPAELADRILTTYRREHAPSVRDQASSPQRVEATAAARGPSIPILYKLGWVAAAACFLVAVTSWWPRATVPAADLYVSVDRQADLISPPWSFNAAGGADPRFANVSGEVHWSTATQRGYMEFDGLPVNDPTKQQYQLWIVDPGRDAEPVDGGVFNVTQTGRVRVPIDAKLPIVHPAAFALTVEKPGGVVVSDGPLQLVAAVKG